MFLDRIGKGDRLRAPVFAEASSAPCAKYEIRSIFKYIVGRRGAHTYNVVSNENTGGCFHLVTFFFVFKGLYTRDVCYALHVRSRSHIEETFGKKKQTFAFFLNNLWRKSFHIV